MELLIRRDRASECRVMAARLEYAAREHEETAAACWRAAAKCRAGAHLALADVMVEIDGEGSPRMRLVDRISLGEGRSVLAAQPSRGERDRRVIGMG